MLRWLAQKIFGTKNERDLKRLQPYVSAICELEPQIQSLSDDQLRAKTAEFKEKLKQGYLRTKLIIEIAGFPEEHVNHTLNLIKEKLLELNGVESVKTKIREAKKISERMWSGFVEIEILVDKLSSLLGICFDFMPSSVEIIEPETITEDSGYLSDVINDLAAKLHHYDAVAKMLRAKLALKEKESKPS